MTQRPHVDPISAASMGLVECTAPLFKLEEGSARAKALRPRRGQLSEGAAVCGGMPEKAADALLTSTR